MQKDSLKTITRQFNEYDLLKVFATLLVVIGHVTIRYNDTSYPGLDTSLPVMVTQIIYLFHMPLFMALSGAIFDLGKQSGKYVSFTPFVLNKTKRLLVPYILVGTCFLVPSMYFFNSNGTNNIIFYYKNLLWGTDCRHLWYLLALFEIFILHYTLTRYLKITNNLTLLLCSIIIATLYSRYCQFDLYSFNMAIRYYPYFIIGTLATNCENIPKRKIYYFVYIAVTVILAYAIKISHNTVADIFLSILLPMPIIGFLLLFSKTLIQRFDINRKWFGCLLNYSFPIYLFHIPAIYLYDKIIPFISLAISIPATIIAAILISFVITKIIRGLHGQFFIGEK